MKKFTYFTSEFVSPGHPDKVSDQISDAVLDACLKDDPNSRVACEVFCTTGLVVVGGEITTSTYIDVQDIVRKKIDEIGYRPGMGFDSNCGTLSCIHAQSPDIAMGVDIGGAGDQGIMFGGAVRETEELMPLALVLSREILVKLTNMMKNNEITWARPDQKSQVTLAYDENGKVDHVDSIVVSVQHDEKVSHDEIEKTVIEKVVKPVLEKYNLSSENIKYYINPRWVAKNIVAAELADKCEIQLSYAIGVPKPVSIKVDTFGTSKVDEDKISEAVSKVFDLSPRGIEKALELREGKFKYQDLAAFGHIGRTDIDTPWERLNKVDELKKSIN